MQIDQADAGRRLAKPELRIRPGKCSKKGKSMRKILVVDDDRALRGLFSAVLRRAGYTVTQAEDGQQAQAQVLRDPPDIMLVDYLMPVLDGLELLTWIKQGPHADISVIVLSAVESQHYIQQFLTAGAHSVLQKPIALDDLLAVVASLG